MIVSLKACIGIVRKPPSPLFFFCVLTTAESRAKILPEKYILKAPSGFLAVHSKEVVLLLLVHRLLLLQLLVWNLCLVRVL